MRRRCRALLRNIRRRGTALSEEVFNCAHLQNGGAGYGTAALADDVAERLQDRAVAADEEAHAHCWVHVAARYRAQHLRMRKGHFQSEQIFYLL